MIIIHTAVWNEMRTRCRVPCAACAVARLIKWGHDAQIGDCVPLGAAYAAGTPVERRAAISVRGACNHD